MKSLMRPSKAENLERLRARGETLAAFTIREASEADAPALARVHVTTWNATHGRPLGRTPSYELRLSQWTTKLATEPDGSFCYVLESAPGSVVGFASGQAYDHSDLPDFDAQLGKIYLLADYQRLGLGRRLFETVVRRHVAAGKHAMVLFSQADNPSCAFFDALGGERLLAPNGDFHGAFGWRDLAAFPFAAPTA